MGNEQSFDGAGLLDSLAYHRDQRLWLAEQAGNDAYAEWVAALDAIDVEIIVSLVLNAGLQPVSDKYNIPVEALDARWDVLKSRWGEAQNAETSETIHIDAQLDRREGQDHN